MVLKVQGTKIHHTTQSRSWTTPCPLCDHTFSVFPSQWAARDVVQGCHKKPLQLQHLNGH